MQRMSAARSTYTFMYMCGVCMSVNTCTPICNCIFQQKPQLAPELKKPVFRIIPDKFVLEPYETCIITLEGSAHE